MLQEIEKGTGEISEYAEKIVSRDPRRPAADLLAPRGALRPPELGVAHPRTGMWRRIFEEMKAKGIAVLETEGENAGCWVVKDKELGDDKVLVRSDGTVVYVAKDIPYAAWKIGLVGDQFSYRVYGHAARREHAVEHDPDKEVHRGGGGAPDHPEVRRGGPGDIRHRLEAEQAPEGREQGPREAGGEGEAKETRGTSQGVRGGRALEEVG